MHGFLSYEIVNTWRTEILEFIPPQCWLYWLKQQQKSNRQKHENGEQSKNDKQAKHLIGRNYKIEHTCSVWFEGHDSLTIEKT